MRYPLLASRLPLYLALALLTQCSKCKHDPTPAKPEDQLPPATQTGAGTFGCLLNGQPFLPSGNLATPNFFVIYDPTFHGGNLDVRTYRNTDKLSNKQYLNFGGDSINQVGTYSFITSSTFPMRSTHTVYFSDDNKSSPCNYYNYFPGTTTKGQLTITRLDKQQGIISGTFQFILAQPGCDTLRFTNGRFDYKL